MSSKEEEGIELLERLCDAWESLYSLVLEYAQYHKLTPKQANKIYMGQAEAYLKYYERQRRETVEGIEDEA